MENEEQKAEPPEGDIDDSSAPELTNEAAASPLEPDAWLSFGQASDYLDISKRRLNTLRRQGKIPAQRVGWRGWRFRTADLMAYVASAGNTESVPPTTEAADDTSQKTPVNNFAMLTEIMIAMGPPPDTEKPDAIREESKEAPVVRMVNVILSTAIDNGASDIHIEPDRLNIRIRLRIDGVMQQLMTVPKHIQARLLDRFKVMSDISLYKRASPHQGFIPVKHNESNYNLRVSVVPSYYGESFVLHIMKLGIFTHLEQLGLSPEARQVLDQMAFYKRGLLLIAGPSGAGRTTTASALLNRLNSVERKILTYEDLPELVIGGIEHNYRWKSKGFSPAEAIPALLQHNLDILFLGDLNDAAIAKAAVDAAQTGILVIATITTRDSVDALLRLVAFGVAPLDIANAVVGIVAQHLLPKICTDCGGEGCDICRKTGRKGRVGVFEIRGMYENEREALSGKTPISGLRNLPIGRYVGQTQLLNDACAKAEQGIITTDAVEHLAAILPK